MRAAVLIAIHVAIAAHITHWLLTGRTLSPVEPSEATQTLEKGELNAGFIFFGSAILLTLIFGRFFCGWGCHIVALQDLCGALMKKLGIRPHPFRSRLLAWVPALAAFSMFAWPTLKREVVIPLLAALAPLGVPGTWHAEALPPLTVQLYEEHFWATFPNWYVAIPFLLICGFATVYLLGAKGFCTYGCPYGAVFGAVDRLAPGKILADLSRCEGCGHCTATCTSNVRVHEEIQVYSRVVNPGCMKCLDCVSVCPNDALSYGFSSPSLFAPKIAGAKVKKRYDLSIGEEVSFAALFALVFFAARGAYGLIAMLMALGIAGTVTFTAWKMWRLLRDREVRLHRFNLRSGGLLLTGGRVYLVLGAALLVAVLHTGVLNAVQSLARHYYGKLPREQLDPAASTPLTAEMREYAQHSLDLFTRAQPFWEGGWGMIAPPKQQAYPLMERLALALGEQERALAFALQAYAASDKADPLAEQLALDIFHINLLLGREEQGMHFLAAVVAENFAHANARTELCLRYMERGDEAKAEALYRSWLALHPDDAVAHAELATRIYMPSNRAGDAVAELQLAIAARPELVGLYHDLAFCLVAAHRLADAILAMRRAVELAPAEPDYLLKLIRLLESAGRTAEAEALKSRSVR